MDVFSNSINMYWFEWISLGAFCFFLTSSAFHLIHLLRLGKPRDYSLPAGNVASSVRYSFTGAMNPAKKESAYLHLPTYTAGIIYHTGTFLSLILFFLILADINLPVILSLIVFSFLVIAFSCGTGILLKRIMKKGLRDLSAPDDYISNLLVTVFQLMTGLALLVEQIHPAYFIITTILFIYFPLGKLKHAVYFFAARYHLGFFFGWRGTWPPK
jgi:hypothetical protein